MRLTDRRSRFLEALFGCAILLLVSGSFAQADLTAVRHVNVVDLERERVVPLQTIVVDSGRIVSLGPDGEINVPSSAAVVDASGKYAIPGLWDMHVHLARAGEYFLPILVSNGVTHVRDMGGPYEDVYRLRAEVAAGTRLGPRILAAGPILESARWVERARAFLSDDELAARIPVTSTQECESLVDEILAGGADFLKFRTVQSRDAYLALAEAARARGVALVGHAPPPAVSLLEAAQAGQRSIEHYIRIVGVKPLPEDTDAAFTVFREAGTHFVPTLVSGEGFRLVPDERAEAVIADDAGAINPRRRYIPASMIAKWKTQLEMKRNERMELDYAQIHADNVTLFAQMYRAGLPIMTGTDLTGPLVYPGYSLHDELAKFVDDLGMSPADALRSATRVPAKFTGQDATFGSIEADRTADFVLLDANPLDDIRNTQGIWAVATGSWFLSREELDRMLAEAAATAKDF